MTVVIGVDPGKTVGIAVARAYELPTVASDQIEFDAFGAWLEGWLTWSANTSTQTLVACERFTINAGTVRKGSQDASWAIECIGVARFLSRKYEAAFRLQAPSTAKNFSPDPLLREHGMYARGDHARDAVRHVVLALAEVCCTAPPWVVESTRS